MTVVLETERLIFRPHVEADFSSYVVMESDPIYRSPQPVRSITEQERSFRQTWLPPSPMSLLATVYKPDGHYIGRCGLYPARDERDQIIPGDARIAFYLARPYWGRGLATEAGRAFVTHGFETLGLRRIEAGINAGNAASLRVIEKLGFQWVRSGEGNGSRWHDFELWNPDRR